MSMAMELEYPFKMILYMFVVAVIVGLILMFRSKFVNICFLPPCEKEENICPNEPVKVNEDALNENVLSKYYNLCREKTKDCQKDIFCYIISFNSQSNPQTLNPDCLNNGGCEITCDKDVSMVYMYFNWPKNKIEIGC